MISNSTSAISQTVKTFDGSVAFRKDCRYIKGEYYVKNKQCFLIDDTWYRVNSGFIAFDHETQKWAVIKDNPRITKGITGFDVENNQAIMGYFTPNAYRNVTVTLSNGTQMTCFDFRSLPMSLFKEDKYANMFVHNSLRLTKSPVFNFNNHGYPYQLQYCMKHYHDEFLTEMRDGMKSRVLAKSALKLTEYAGVLGKLTFGVEFETTNGKIPNYKIQSSGLIPLRDGSITGIEYATLPLSGAEGVRRLEDACDQLADYTTISHNESTHLHIGGFKTSEKFLAYLYTLCCIIEPDVYSIFPRYYAKTSAFKARQKDYNMPLRKELVSSDWKETFSNLSYYLSAGKKYSGFGANHPSDPNGDHKWGINERYHWVNFIPALFGSTGTVEFRCHVPTRDPIKLINWLYICAAIIRVAEDLSNRNADMATRMDLSLEKIINMSYSGKLAMYLCKYVHERKEYRMRDDANGDFIGKDEIADEMKGKTRFQDIQ